MGFWQFLTITLIFNILAIKSQTLDQCAHEPDALCFDPTCGFPLSDPHVGGPCYCVDEDIGASYSDCSNGTRQLFYFWRPPATCIGGQLPPPINGIPCNLVCGAGTFLNTSTLSCQSCSPGSSSDGGGHRFTQWTEWPAQFRTYCALGGTTSGTCNSWRILDDHTIDSGDNRNLHYLSSVLEFRVRLVRTGYVTFRYRVSAEQNFDGLWFVVNNLGLLFVSNAGWTTFNRTLAPGYYNFQWQYYKDRTITAGEDRVQISMIEVVGTTFAEIECEVCGPGFYQDQPGSYDCKPCPPRQYADVPGLSQCKPCPDGQTSNGGASSCFFERICNSTSDYSYNYTQCIGGQRSKTYVWIEPAVCNKQGAVLPPPENQSCVVGMCPSGQYYDTRAQTCLSCPPGTYRKGAMTTCSGCPNGTSASLRHLVVNRWRSWSDYDFGSPVVTRTGCMGECFQGQGGWRLGQWFTDSGLANGEGVRSWLALFTAVLPGAVLNVNYSLACQAGNSLSISVNRQLVAEFDCQSNVTDCGFPPFNTFSTVLVPPTNDPHFINTAVNVTIFFVYVKDTPQVMGDCDRAIISYISIDGAASPTVGSMDCANCPAGTYAIAASPSCSPCSNGTYSNPQSSVCTMCPPTQFADDIGTPRCIPCPLGKVNHDQDRCFLNCSQYSIFNPTNNRTLSYNLSSFNSIHIPYVDVKNDSTTTYYIHASLCGWMGQCTYLSGAPMNSHSCLVSDSGYENVNLGKSLSANFMQRGPSTGLILTTSFGNPNCTFTLNLQCEPSIGVGTPAIITPSQWSTYSNSCNYQIYWGSSYGCPMCTENDISSYTTACTNGVQQTVYTWSNPFCYGGVSLPSPTQTDCASYVTVHQNVIAIVVSVTVVTLVIAIGFVVFLWWKNRKLYQDYQKLKTQDVPMDENN